MEAYAAQIQGLISTQAARGHVLRIREWEERIRRAWKEKPSEVYKGVRETAPGRTVFLKRDDGTLTGNWAEMQELAQDAWTSQVYCKPGRPRVDVPSVVQKYRGHLEARRVPLTLLPLTAEDLKATLGGWPADKAGGADGWTPRDFKDIPLCLLRLLAQLYELIEAGAPWPAALTEGVVALVPKKATAGGPLDQRPVTLTNLGYRLWSGCRCRQASTWVRNWAHPPSLRRSGGPRGGRHLGRARGQS